MVHVIHNGSANRISEECVYSGIQMLNDDLLATLGTKGEAGLNAEIKVVLATEDPDGNPTTGLVYHDDAALDDSSFGDLKYTNLKWLVFNWDVERYLNIFIKDEGRSTTLGFAYYPDRMYGRLQQGEIDGVHIGTSYWGECATSQRWGLGGTMTHELGHYMGLLHTFHGQSQRACAAGDCYRRGDLVCDTNTEKDPTYGCPESKISCSSQDPINNYMDYSDDSCLTEFTREQALRARCVLESYRPGIIIPPPLSSAPPPFPGAAGPPTLPPSPLSGPSTSRTYIVAFSLQLNVKCTNECNGFFISDNECDDGGEPSNYDLCDIGTDCIDCGPRPGQASTQPRRLAQWQRVRRSRTLET